MKSIKKMSVLILLLLVGNMMQAQKNNFSLTANVGHSIVFLGGEPSLQASLNPHLSLDTKIGVEAQLSYTQLNLTKGFFTESQRTETMDVGSCLVGARLYLNGPEKRVRPYVNLLAGATYISGKGEGELLNPWDNFDRGVSAGAFIEIYNVLIGASVDSFGKDAELLIVKVGYTF